MPSHPYTPTIRAALLAALDTPTRSLRRAPGGFVAIGQPIKTSAPRMFQAFTRRAINWLEREGLAEFDEPEFPRSVALTPAGVAAAEQIKAEKRTRAARS